MAKFKVGDIICGLHCKIRVPYTVTLGKRFRGIVVQCYERRPTGRDITIQVKRIDPSNTAIGDHNSLIGKVYDVDSNFFELFKAGLRTIKKRRTWVLK